MLVQLADDGGSDIPLTPILLSGKQSNYEHSIGYSCEHALIRRDYGRHFSIVAIALGGEE